jgi:L-cysteine S-thiosulfotransferase
VIRRPHRYKRNQCVMNCQLPTSTSGNINPRTYGERWWRISSALANLTVTLNMLATAHAAEIPLDERKSGYEFMGRETRAIQDDDTANPGLFAVLDGEALWNRKAGTADKSCADCHGDATTSMKGVAARYPVFSPKQGRPIDLEGRINLCRTEQQKAPALALESKDLLALETYVGRQSRGMPIAVEIDGPAQPFFEAGRATFLRRQGQLNFACASCHDDNWREKLAGSPITQAHPTGYPLYRLEWQAVGSLQRRLRSCLAGMRAEPYPYGAPELVDLELYLKWRARGLAIETPAVRP